MRHCLVWENGVEIGFWHSRCSIGQVIDTNKGRVQVVDIEYAGSITYYTVEKVR